jgi:polysaccharide pyruvyl transferase WcaK-like protein
MRILVDCCNYFLDNNNSGDRAAYQVLEMRLRHFWPDAEISWITLDPRLIQQTIPSAIPFTLEQRHHWQLFTSIQKPKAPGVSGLISNWLGRSYPNKVQRTLLDTLSDINVFMEKISEADLVVGLGGGALSDHFPEHARGLLDTLEAGLVFEKPVALLSAGFETISNQSLLEKCKRVLPRLQLITCREPSIGPAMLSNLGVPDERVYITGDQAVELAYHLRPDQPGLAIGVNLRQSTYSEIDEKPIEIIRAVVQEAGYKYQVPLLGAPISIFGPSDVESIQKIIAGYRGFADSGEKLDGPELVIRQIGKCRILITGSYHSAVFALAQGIPVVGIARSLHYQAKLKGLAAQFSCGCSIVDPEDLNFGNTLRDAIDEAWDNAIAFKEPLLETARSQIAEGWKASQQLFNIVTGSREV